MSRPSSATTSAEAGSLWRGIVVGSTQPELVARDLGIVPRTAETLPMVYRSCNVPAASFKNIQDVISKYLADMNARAGMVTCLYTRHTGSFLFESPTFRLTTEPFALWGPFGAIPAESEHRISLRSTSLPVVMTVLVAGLGAAAQLMTPAPGLLNSTDPALGAPRLAESKFAEAVALAGEEWFEDGVESRFSQALSTLLHMYGFAAVATVETFLGSPSSNVEVAVEAAQWLGEVDHPASMRYRKSLLEKLLLRAPSTRLRQGAAAGLAALDDPSSLPVVTEALGRESNRRLRHFLQLVVDQLERTRACPSS